MEPQEPMPPVESVFAQQSWARQVIYRLSRSAVAWSFVATGMRFGSAAFVLPLILRRVPPEELGLWYVFLSLGYVTSLLDLGFASAVLRSAAYVWAGARKLLPWGIDRVATEENLQPDSRNLPLLADLVASLRLYYFVVGVAVFAVLTICGGAWIWHKSVLLPNRQSLRAAFLVYALSVSLNFAYSIWGYLLSAVNGVRQSQQILIASLATYYLIAVTGLLLGLKIWAVVLGVLVMGVTERLLGRAVFNRLAPLPRGQFRWDIIRTLWPNAWRAGAVSFGIFLILQANTLICSAFLDLKTTASYGLSLQAATLLVGVSSVWVTVKWPVINHLRARSRLYEIAALFAKRVRLAVLTFIAGGSALVAVGPSLLAILKAQTHFLPTAALIGLLVVQLLEMHHSLYAGLVYSENVNPFLKPILISGFAIVLISILLVPRIGIWGLVLSAGVVQLAFNNWWSVLRGVRGLGQASHDYWLIFFGKRTGTAEPQTS
jgi:O-antigen/teichoic acid export membrane protein